MDFVGGKDDRDKSPGKIDYSCSHEPGKWSRLVSVTFHRMLLGIPLEMSSPWMVVEGGGDDQWPLVVALP